MPHKEEKVIFTRALLEGPSVGFTQRAADV